MANRQPVGHKERGYLGSALVTLGLAALLADFAFLAPPFEQLLETGRQGLLSLVPTLGLTLLQAARAIALQQIDYFSVVSRILVLFSAIVVIVIGAVVLKAGSAAAPAAPDQQSFAASVEGDR